MVQCRRVLLLLVRQGRCLTQEACQGNSCTCSKATDHLWACIQRNSSNTTHTRTKCRLHTLHMPHIRRKACLNITLLLAEATCQPTNRKWRAEE